MDGCFINLHHLTLCRKSAIAEDPSASGGATIDQLMAICSKGHHVFSVRHYQNSGGVSTPSPPPFPMTIDNSAVWLFLNPTGGSSGEIWVITQLCTVQLFRSLKPVTASYDGVYPAEADDNKVLYFCTLYSRVKKLYLLRLLICNM